MFAFALKSGGSAVLKQSVLALDARAHQKQSAHPATQAHTNAANHALFAHTYKFGRHGGVVAVQVLACTHAETSQGVHIKHKTVQRLAMHCCGTTGTSEAAKAQQKKKPDTTCDSKQIVSCCHNLMQSISRHWMLCRANCAHSPRDAMLQGQAHDGTLLDETILTAQASAGMSSTAGAPQTGAVVFATSHFACVAGLHNRLEPMG
jgi:hypothetical protein